MRPAKAHNFNRPENWNLSLRDPICEAGNSTISRQAVANDQTNPSCRELGEQLRASRNTVFVDCVIAVQSRSPQRYHVGP